jgi:hypothetical protein
MVMCSSAAVLIINLKLSFVIAAHSARFISLRVFTQEDIGAQAVDRWYTKLKPNTTAYVVTFLGLTISLRLLTQEERRIIGAQVVDR